MILNASAFRIPLSDQSVRAVITSIPYYRMRGYDIPPVLIGGDPDCEHEFAYYIRKGRSGGKNSDKLKIKGSENFQIIPDQKQGWCENCDGWLGQYGNEPSLTHYITNTLLWTNEANRVLTGDGTLWINISDTYAREDDRSFKPKDLMLVPFEMAHALRRSGWYLRFILPWFKRNALASHAPDRPVINHEYVLVFSKSNHYKYNQVKVQGTTQPRLRRSMDYFLDSLQAILDGENVFLHFNDEPLALVYNNQGYKGGHFAPFATSFAEAMILAATDPGDLVLDPFMGSGSTAVAAQKLDRKWVGVELGWGYAFQAAKRIYGTAMPRGTIEGGQRLSPPPREES